MKNKTLINPDGGDDILYTKCGSLVCFGYTRIFHDKDLSDKIFVEIKSDNLNRLLFKDKTENMISSDASKISAFEPVNDTLITKKGFVYIDASDLSSDSRGSFLIKENEIFFPFLKERSFSQWADVGFNCKGIYFDNCEQFVMYSKAMLFKDEKAAAWILSTKNPNSCKKIGRLVSDFNEDVWTAYRRKIVFEGNYAKFSQNNDVKQDLFDTACKTMVECNTYDSIWSCRLAKHNRNINDRTKWKGANLLGEILTEVRDVLISEES